MQIRKHLLEHIFIIATSIAMVVHSTWTFGTLFAGKQPIPMLSPLDIPSIVAYLFWLIPALLVAVAIDIGQIQTAMKLAKSNHWGHKAALFVTFIALAVAGFYLQWYNLAHHIPFLEFAPGLTSETQAEFQGFKDLAIIFIPALLPISVVLYTVSLVTEQSDPDEDESEDNMEEIHIDIERPVGGSGGGSNPFIEPGALPIPELPGFEDELEETQPNEPIDAENAHNLTCPDCGWETGPRLRLESAERSLRTHQARYCEAVHVEVE